MRFSQLKNKKILITGVNGFIGSSLAKTFIAHNAKVYGTIRKTSNLSKLEMVKREIQFHVVNLEDSDEVSGLLRNIKPEYIIHTAQPSAYELNAAIYFQNQIASTTRIVTNILESTRLISPLKIIQCCGSVVYGVKNKNPFSEDQEPLPDSARGMVKLNERNIFRFYAHQYNLPIVLARIFRAYGPFDSSEKLILKALQAKHQKSLISISSSPYMRDFIYIDDLIEAILLMCISSTPSGVELNIGSGSQFCAAEIIELMNEIMGESIPVSETSYKANFLDKLAYQADISSAKKILGWQPKTSMVEGLRKTIEWAQNI